MLSKRDRAAAFDMLAAAKRALRYATEVDDDAFARDEMRRDAATNALTILGEASKRVSVPSRGAFSGLNWRELSDIRQFVVHKYFLVDPKELRKTILERIPAIIAVVEAGLEREK